MRTPANPFRRNFLVAAVLHAVVVAAVWVFEDGLSARSTETGVAVELFTPADLLGDMPKGDGVGRGQYTAPAADDGGGGGRTQAALPSSSEAFTPEERPAPAPPVARPVAPTPRTTAVKAAPAPASASRTAAKTTKPKPKPATTAARGATPSRSGSGTGTGSGSASAIRNRFAGALASAAGGTAYGDNRAPGGGNGSSPVIGSPNGSPDGMAGGVGQGSPFWRYYQHVHDRMYEAWEQPGEALNWNKNLVATVLLRVARDGRIVEVRLRDPSGNRLMDDSAVAAAKSVLRLDPLPDGLRGDPAEITVNFRLES